MHADICDLWSFDIGKNYFAAACDTNYQHLEQDVRNCEELGVDGKEAYFNCGVLIADLDAMRKVEFVDRAMAFLRENAGQYRVS